MKNKSIKNRILALGVWCALSFIGCAGKEPVFTDVQIATEESTVQEEVAECATYDMDVTGIVMEEAQPVVVHVCGAVINPGVYELPAGSRSIEAVKMAGGLSEDAAERYVNLAKIPVDGEQIYIPTNEEALILEQELDRNGTSSGKVNINTADKALLCTLPGIGDTRASDIIAYRQEHGSFLVIEDIMQVNGIKEGGFQKIKELITVN